MLTRVFTRWATLRLQVAFVRNGEETEHSSITDLQFRGSLTGTEAPPPPWPDALHGLMDTAFTGAAATTVDEGTAISFCNSRGDEVASMMIHGGGAGGGTSNYNALLNKPAIEGRTLKGDMTAASLGLVGTEAGKALSSNDYTTAEKSKLAGIAVNANHTAKTSQLLNDSNFAYTNDPRFTDARPASDVSAWAKAPTKPAYTKSEVGLGNADNTADINKPVSMAVQTALNALGKIESGTNGNGTYVKLPDGTLLCSKIKTYTNVQITTPSGAAMFISGPLSGVGGWAADFIGTPAMHITVVQGISGYGGADYIYNRATDSIYLTRWSTATIPEIEMHYTAQGRWK